MFFGKWETRKVWGIPWEHREIIHRQQPTLPDTRQDPVSYPSSYEASNANYCTTVPALAQSLYIKYSTCTGSRLEKWHGRFQISNYNFKNVQRNIIISLLFKNTVSLYSHSIRLLGSMGVSRSFTVILGLLQGGTLFMWFRQMLCGENQWFWMLSTVQCIG